MQGMEWLGKMLVLGGLLMALIGGLVWLMARLPGLDRLPGTIRIERPGFTCVFPLLGSILLSVILTIVLNIIIRILNR